MGSKRRGAIAQPCGRDRGAVDLERRRALETKSLHRRPWRRWRRWEYGLVAVDSAGPLFVIRGIEEGVV